MYEPSSGGVLLRQGRSVRWFHAPMYDVNGRYMIVLAIDTCEARGSVALLRDDSVVQIVVHKDSEEYSSWLLPAAGGLLAFAGFTIRDVELFAVAPGPGSFTGVRIGLTTVKAWSEALERPIAAVSRLEALASLAAGDAGYVGTFIDAQRGQLFGAIYNRQGTAMELVGEEMVATAESFVTSVADQIGTAKVAWVSSDPAVVENAPNWQVRTGRGAEILRVSSVLAPVIGKLGFQKALAGKVLDALSLDANYVRRSYAEVSWKCIPNAAGK